MKVFNAEDLIYIEVYTYENQKMIKYANSSCNDIRCHQPLETEDIDVEDGIYPSERFRNINLASFVICNETLVPKTPAYLNY